mmetsp:Transcript_61070/g.157487  ORF Transcript_61070/g.157487 Transcript_61070/m.157487 type:complete len:248 (+) Transcript_61070:261-1004(+)
MWHRGKGRELGRQGLAVQADERALVPHLVTVVGCREHGDALASMIQLVALLLHLMASDHQLQAVGLQEVLRDILPKSHANAALGGHAAPARLRIAPQHLRHQPLVGRLALAVHLPNVVELHPIPREQAAMHDEDLAIDDVAQGQQAERLAEELVQLLIIFVRDLALEAVELVHVPRLVVAPCKVDVAGVEELPGKECQDDLDGKGPTIHEVAVEHVRVLRRRHSIHLPDVKQVVVLTMHVTANRDRA